MQFTAACIEKCRLDMLDARFRCHMIMNRVAMGLTWQQTKGERQ